MNHEDNIEIVLAMLNGVKERISTLEQESALGSKSMDMLERASIAIDDAIDNLGAYQSDYEEYVDSGQAARDFLEGELLKQAEARDD